VTYKTRINFFALFAFISLGVPAALATEVMMPKPLSENDALQMVLAPKRWADPENLYGAGVDLGVYQSCGGVPRQVIDKAKKDVRFGVTLATTSFDHLNGVGYRNERLYQKLTDLFERGFIKGVREGRLMRGQSGWRGLCNWIKSTWIDGDLKDLPTGFVVR
jgi:hypothetical protein